MVTNRDKAIERRRTMQRHYLEGPAVPAKYFFLEISIKLPLYNHLVLKFVFAYVTNVPRI